MKSFHRILAMVMALILIASLAACGTKPPQAEEERVFVSESAKAGDQNESEAEAEALEPLAVTEFSGQLRPALENGENIVSACAWNERVYILTRTMDTGAWSVHSRIYAMEPDGTDQTLLVSKTTELPDASQEMNYLYGIGILSFCVCADGSVWYTENARTDITASIRRVVHTDAADEVRAELECEGVSNLLPMPDGGAAIFADSLTVVDADGRTLFSILPDGSWWEDSAVLSDGSIAVLLRDNMSGSYMLKRLDTDAGQLVTVAEMPARNMRLAGGSWEALWLFGGSVRVWEPETDTLTEKLNFSTEGLNSSNIRNVTLISDNRLLVSERKIMEDSESLILYVLPAGGSARPQSGEKTVLRLAGVSIPYSLTEAVLAFNRENREYAVEIEDYFNYSTTDDYYAGKERLLYEIGTGDLPDIICFGNDISAEDMTGKGYLADIGALIDADESIDRSELMENVLDAAELDGTLYTLPLGFHIETVLGRSDITGTSPCTVENVRAWITENPDIEAFYGMTRDLFLCRLIWANADALIDADSGTCRFDSDDFIQLLELSALLPVIFPTGGNLAAQDCLFISSYAMTLSTLADDSFGGRGYSPTGYPGIDGGKTLLSPYPELGISASAADTDGCLALLRYLLSREVQEEMNDFDAIPVRRDVFDEKIEEMYEKCEEGLFSEARVEAAAYTASSEVVYHRAVSMVNQLSTIAAEEAQSFFNGDRTAEDTAARIQSRASIYMAEQG